MEHFIFCVVFKAGWISGFFPFFATKKNTFPKKMSFSISEIHDSYQHFYVKYLQKDHTCLNESESNMCRFV